VTRRKADTAEGRWLQGHQVASLLGVGIKTVRYMGERGELVRRRSHAGAWRYLESSVRRYVDADLERLALADEIEGERG
jgi:hypothetical protein